LEKERVGAKRLSQRDHNKLERSRYIPKTREEDLGFFKGEIGVVDRERDGKIPKSAATPMGASNKR
jgi:hypothetical protein